MMAFGVITWQCRDLWAWSERIQNTLQSLYLGDKHLFSIQYFLLKIVLSGEELLCTEQHTPPSTALPRLKSNHRTRGHLEMESLQNMQTKSPSRRRVLKDTLVITNKKKQWHFSSCYHCLDLGKYATIASLSRVPSPVLSGLSLFFFFPDATAFISSALGKLKTSAGRRRECGCRALTIAVLSPLGTGRHQEVGTSPGTWCQGGWFIA